MPPNRYTFDWLMIDDRPSTLDPHIPSPPMVNPFRFCLFHSAVVTTVYVKYVGMVSSLDIWMVGTRVNKLLT